MQEIYENIDKMKKTIKNINKKAKIEVTAYTVLYTLFSLLLISNA